MSFKKYLLSMSVCLVFIFVLIARMFEPIPASAATDWNTTVAQILSSNGVANTNYFSISEIASLNWLNSSTVETQYNNFLSIASEAGFDAYISSSCYYSSDANNSKGLSLFAFNSDNVSSITYSNGYLVVNFKNANDSYEEYYVQGKNLSSNPSPGSMHYPSLQYSGSIKTNILTSSSSKGYWIYGVTYNVFGADSGTDEVTDSSTLGKLGNFFKNYFFNLKDDFSKYGDAVKGVVAAGLDITEDMDIVSDALDASGLPNVRGAFYDYLRGLLGISEDDDDTLQAVLTNIYNNDYSSDYWVDVDNTTITNIQHTTNNLQSFVNRSISIQNVDDDSYYYVVNNYYPSQNVYPDYYYDTNYFNTYIVYEGGSTSEADLVRINDYLYLIWSRLYDVRNAIVSGFSDLIATVNTDFNSLFALMMGTDEDEDDEDSVSLTKTNKLLKSIYNKLDDIYDRLGWMAFLESVDTLSDLLDNFLSVFDLLADVTDEIEDVIEEGKDILDTFDDLLGDLVGEILGSLISDFLNQLLYPDDCDSSVATNFKLILQDLLGDLTFNVNVSIGDDDGDGTTTEPSEPDTTTTPTEPSEPDTTTTPTEPSEPDTTTAPDVVIVEDDDGDDEFWKRVRDIIITKVPLYTQCLELLEPTTDTPYDSLDYDGNYLLGDPSDSDYVASGASLDSYNSSSSVSSSADTVFCFDYLLCIITDDGSRQKTIKFCTFATFYGYTFNGVDIDISYYYYYYRTLVSNVLLAVCYLAFAWSIVHRVMRMFGGERSDNDNNTSS